MCLSIVSRYVVTAFLLLLSASAGGAMNCTDATSACSSATSCRTSRLQYHATCNSLIQGTTKECSTTCRGAYLALVQDASASTSNLRTCQCDSSDCISKEVESVGNVCDIMTPTTTTASSSDRKELATGTSDAQALPCSFIFTFLLLVGMLIF